MRITIIYHGAFPYGEAGPNRILSYSKNIVKLGHEVVVHCIQPTNDHPGTEINPATNGKYQGVEYVFTSNRKTWPRDDISVFYKVFYLIKGYLNSYRLLKQYKDMNDIDIIYLYSNRLSDILFYFMVSKIIKTPYVQEKSEYPFVLRNKTWLGKIYAYLYISYVYKLFDGMVIETNTLIEFFKNKIRKDTQICRIPMTVDIERFNLEPDKQKNENYIAYCGNMQKPDGITILIEAFSIIANKHPDIKLYLIGKSQDNLFNEYIKRVDELGLNNRVNFMGKISSLEVPRLLINAKLLVLASPKSQRSTGSLPSKLGEYLATGNPTLVTSVGEIPRYLTDGVNAFLVKPDSVEAFAEKMDFILKNYDKAHEIGQKGKEIASHYFNAEYQADKMITFFKKLKNSVGSK